MTMQERIRPVMPRDQEQVCRWLKNREAVELFDFRLLPPTGFIIADIAAGWIYRTDGPVAILDPLVRNPEISKEEADSALDAIVEKLIQRAKSWHPTGLLPSVRVILAHARQPAVLARAEQFGFLRGHGDYTPLRLEV